MFKKRKIISKRQEYRLAQKELDLERIKVNVPITDTVPIVDTHNICTEAALIAYHAHVHSRIGYGILLWGNGSEVDRILILQKRCLRNIYNLKQQDSCRRLFGQLGILTVVSTYIYEASVFIKKHNDLFSGHMKTHSYSTRNKSDLVYNRTNLSYIQKNTHCSIIRVFNWLPSCLRQLPLKRFKIKLKNFLAKRTYYTMEEYFSDTFRC